MKKKIYKELHPEESFILSSNKSKTVKNTDEVKSKSSNKGKSKWK